VLFIFLPLGSRATIVSVLLSRLTPPRHYGIIFGILGIGNNLGRPPAVDVGRALRPDGILPGDLSLRAGIGLVGLFTLAAFVLMTREAASAGPRAR
jgi:hypothetical protein